MEQYTKNQSLYPYANFHYVGHSNGTYLVAKALEEYSWCKFDRIVFAGSVVDSHYDWEEKIEKGQVKKILNFVASGDWVVGWFPNLFRILPFGFNKDLGGAGHNGFHIKNPVPNDWDYQIKDTQNESETIYTTNKAETICQSYLIGSSDFTLDNEYSTTIKRSNCFSILNDMDSIGSKMAVVKLDY